MSVISSALKGSVSSTFLRTIAAETSRKLSGLCGRYELPRPLGQAASIHPSVSAPIGSTPAAPEQFLLFSLQLRKAFFGVLLQISGKLIDL